MSKLFSTFLLLVLVIFLSSCGMQNDGVQHDLEKELIQQQNEATLQPLKVCNKFFDCNDVEGRLDGNKIIFLKMNSGNSLKIINSNWNGSEGWGVDELGTEWSLYSLNYFNELHINKPIINTQVTDTNSWNNVTFWQNTGVTFKVPYDLKLMSDPDLIPLKYVLLDDVHGGGLFDIYLKIGEEGQFDERVAEKNCLDKKQLNANVECIINDVAGIMSLWIPDSTTAPDGSSMTMGIFSRRQDNLFTVFILYSGANNLKAKGYMMGIGNSMVYNP